MRHSQTCAVHSDVECGFCTCGAEAEAERDDEVARLRASLEDAALSLEAAAKGAPMSNSRLAAEIARARLSGKTTL